MGCYGIGISRVAAAAVEQNNDENGIIWPLSIAPYEVDIIATNMKNEDIVKTSEQVYKLLKDENIDVIYDDRNEKAGFKFKDADLIGFPIKIIIGNKASEGIVELKTRDGKIVEEVKIDNLTNIIKYYRMNL